MDARNRIANKNGTKLWTWRQQSVQVNATHFLIKSNSCFARNGKEVYEIIRFVVNQSRLIYRLHEAWVSNISIFHFPSIPLRTVRCHFSIQYGFKVFKLLPYCNEINCNTSNDFHFVSLLFSHIRRSCSNKWPSWIEWTIGQSLGFQIIIFNFELMLLTAWTIWKWILRCTESRSTIKFHQIRGNQSSE